MDLRFQLLIIDAYCTFTYLLEYRGIDYYDLDPSVYIPGNTVYCPFHENTETKAAKVYGGDEKNRSEKIYCFAENKLYYPHSLLSPSKLVNVDSNYNTQFKGIVPYTPEYVFSAIWNHLPECDKNYWKSVNPDIVVKENVDDSIYDNYRSGKFSLFDVLEKIKNS